MLIESFLDYLRYERNYSDKTVLAYGEDIRQLQEFAQEEYGKFDPLEVEAELIREWIVSLMDKEYTSTSVNRKLSTLRTFYKFLLKKGEVTVDPLRKIVGPKNKKPLPVFLKENEMNKLLDETDFGEGFKGCRDRLIIEMFYATGMRLSELIDLDDKDVDFSGSCLKVTGKRNKQRLIPFGDELRDWMLGYIDVRNEMIPERSEAFFVRENGERLYKNLVYNLVKRNLSKVATLKKKSPHVLRHTFEQPKAPEGAFYAGTSSIRRPIFFFTATKFGNISVRRFVLDIFANGINTLSMFTFIESDIFLFHVLLQVRLPHYQPTVLLTWKLLMALIQ